MLILSDREVEHVVQTVLKRTTMFWGEPKPFEIFGYLTNEEVPVVIDQLEKNESLSHVQFYAEGNGGEHPNSKLINSLWVKLK